MIRRYILTFIAALIVTLSSWAQGGLPSRYNVSYLNMAAGMPNNRSVGEYGICAE